MFGKTIQHLNSYQLAWIKSVEHDKIHHMKYAKRLTPQEKEAFLKHSEFLDSVSTQSLREHDVLDIVDFIQMVRGDIYYIQSHIEPPVQKDDLLHPKSVIVTARICYILFFVFFFMASYSVMLSELSTVFLVIFSFVFLIAGSVITRSE